MTNTNITAFRKNLFGFVDQAITYGDVVNVSTRNGNAVLISEADYNNLMETVYLSSIPGMADSIRAGMNEPLDECVAYDPKEPW